MSQIESGDQKKAPWRSLDALLDSGDPQWKEREFMEGASELPDGVSRRTFLKLLGASAAFAGLTGCAVRKPVQTVRPYAKRPEQYVPGEGTFYATANERDQTVTGLLVESHEGRPTKIEGNPGSKTSLGATDAFTQASVLALYDPDRLKVPTFEGKRSELDVFETWVESQRKTGFKKTAILFQESMSPVFYKQLKAFQRRFPSVDIVRYSPVVNNVASGIEAVTGQTATPSYRFDKAKVVLSLESDFLGRETQSVVNTRRFSAKHSPEAIGGMSRLYVLESGLSVTGAKADHRFRVKSSEVEQTFWHIAYEVLQRSPQSGIPPIVLKYLERGVATHAAGIDKKEVREITKDLLKNRGKSIVICGEKFPETVQGLVYLVNLALGNLNRTVELAVMPVESPRLSLSVEGIAKLVNKIDKGSIEQVFVLGGDPVRTAPADIDVRAAFKKVKTVVHFSSQENATTAEAAWVIPLTHYLESWDVLAPQTNEWLIVQPLVQRMVEGYTKNEAISLLSGANKSDYDLARNHKDKWQPSRLSESRWRRFLHEGVRARSSRAGSTAANGSRFLPAFRKAIYKNAPKKDTLEVSFYTDYSVFDGRYINSSWLQELPDPISKLTWDNAAMISPKTAKKFNLKTDDLIQLNLGNRMVEIAAFVQPGQADDSISLTMGYGQSNAGRVGKDTGFNAGALTTTRSMAYFNGIELKKVGKTYPLASTQEHGTIDDRHLVRTGTVSKLKKDPKFVKKYDHAPHQKSLWPEKKYDKGEQWGMVIDLTKCTSCNACVTACQSENNIPVVGKEEVMRGREMHWIRLDRYYEGGEEDPTVKRQPVPCLQCENAPCEQVCPVAATVHSEDGLNDMVYNRCIGTRYCGDNCPAKVRRFNFFDYNQRNPQATVKERKHLFDYIKEPDKSIQKQFNPDVTVRMRGVMEKCTFCVQRINEGRNRAKAEKRSLFDGEIKTACMQSCPADAIVFGDINDAKSRVSQLRSSGRNYTILSELNIKPRTSYLADISNPNKKLEKKSSHKEGHHA